MKRTLGEVAALTGGRVVGDASTVLTGVAGIKEAQEGHLTFVSNPKYCRFLSTTRASAVIVDPASHDASDGGPTPALLVVENAYAAFARAMSLFAEPAPRLATGVHPSAWVSPAAKLGGEVAVGPNAVVMEDAEVGERSAIHPGAYVGAGARIGRDCVIHPNATVKSACVLGDRVIVHSGAVLGSDGFGFARDGSEQVKVPQLGGVLIDDDVEIGANVCIARATVGTTRVGRGTKIDNLVQIAHNVTIGQGSIVVAQVGISGSAEIGDRVVLGGQAGIVGHIRIGDDAMVGAQSGVTKSVPSGEQVSGYPARRHSLSKRVNACIQALPCLFQKVREMEKRLARVEKEDEC